MRRDQNSSLIGPLFTLLAVSYWVGQLILGSRHPNPLAAVFVGIIVLLVFGGAIAFVVTIYSRFSAYRKSWVACPHGVRGGKGRDLCEKCVQDERTAAETYQKRVQAEEQEHKLRKSADELKNREASRLAGSLIPSLEELRKLTPQHFEDEIARMFERLGYAVEQTPYSNDYGRDAILMKNGEKFLVECKRYREEGASGRPELQKFHSAIMSDGARKGYFVTTGTFTKGATEFAETAPIELVDGERLLKFMYESKRDESQDDTYESMCRNCGDIVRHRLRSPSPREVTCRNGHSVAPTLTVENILTVLPGSTPKCVKCGTSMRLVHGRNGPFWGCARYPNCRSTQPYRGAK